MSSTGSDITMRHRVPRIILLAVGISGMLLSVTYDFLRPGEAPQFGKNQVAGFIVSTIVVLAGLHTTRSHRAKTWFGGLLVIYIVGIFVMGLKPYGEVIRLPREFLSLTTPSVSDVVVNLLGFIPLTYLASSWIYLGEGRTGAAKRVFIVLAAAISASLLIESVQYLIPGRTSSAMDLFANSAGAFLGIFYFMVEKSLSKHL